MYSQNDERSLTARTIDYLMIGEAQSREETAQNYKVTLNVTNETTPLRHPKAMAGERLEDILVKDRLYAQAPAPPRKTCSLGNFVSQ